MMPDDLLERAAQEDLEALAQLDANGFICGRDEDAGAFTERLRRLRCNISNMEQALTEQGTFTIEELTVSSQERIPQELFLEVANHCQELYSFQIDWVPGFFINPKASLLFGGCAYYFYPDFFALFIIRKTFRDRDRWLIYRRQELLAHELCHVARIGLESMDYEETFAYQTAASSFRRLAGGLFRRQHDSLMFLGAAMLILAGQLIRTFWLPNLPTWPLWVAMAAVIGWLVTQHRTACRRLGDAMTSAQTVFGDQTRAVLFRCTDQEIRDLARLPHESVQTWLKRQCEQRLRWKIICHRFLQPANTPL
ncbi:MAG TPA: hypothetical protein PKY10_08190 [Lentisphaeria bacterium]|nr:hypothetical protein [Lentisphaeria bacterium]